MRNENKGGGLRLPAEALAAPLPGLSETADNLYDSSEDQRVVHLYVTDTNYKPVADLGTVPHLLDQARNRRHPGLS